MKKYINPSFIFFLYQLGFVKGIKKFGFDFFNYLDFNQDVPLFLQECITNDLVSNLSIIVEKNDIDGDITKDGILKKINIYQGDFIFHKVINKYSGCISKEYFCTFAFECDVNYIKINDYVKKYYELWINNKITNYKGKYLLPSKQLCLFSKFLLEYIEDYGSNNLSFDKNIKYEGEELDTYSLVFYLNSLKLINIKKAIFPLNMNVIFSITENQKRKIEILKNENNTKIPVETKWDEIILQIGYSSKNGGIEIYVKEKKYLTIPFEKIGFYTQKGKDTKIKEFFSNLIQGENFLNSNNPKERKLISKFSNLLKENIIIEDKKVFKIINGDYLPKFTIRLYIGEKYDAYEKTNKIISFNDKFDYIK